MSSNRKLKSKFNFIIIYIIGFIISIFFEFYWITYYPYDYFMLFGIGIIMCIFGYLSIDGILDIINQTTRKRDEQNEIMIKASKAIYLTTKKIALNNSHSEQSISDTHKDLGSLIDELTIANNRLAKEVENAVSIQSLVQENKSIVNNVREMMEDSHEQPLSPLEVEKDLKLDEAIVETDFETITQPEAIDSMMEQEVAATSSEPPETAADIPANSLEDTVEVTSKIEEISDTITDAPSEPPEIPETVEAAPEPEIENENADKPLTPDDIASLFANL